MTCHFFPDSTKAASSFASLAGLNTFPAAEPLPTLKFSKNHRNSFPGKEVPKTQKKEDIYFHRPKLTKNRFKTGLKLAKNWSNNVKGCAKNPTQISNSLNEIMNRVSLAS